MELPEGFKSTIGSVLRRRDPAIQDPALDTIIVALATAIGIACFWFARAVFADGDTSWHLAAGRWMLEHRAVPSTDPFSFSAAGAPWIAHEWLAEVVMAMAYNIGGWSALLALFGLVFGAMLALVASRLLRWYSGVIAILIIAILCTALGPFLLARPHILGWAICALWTTNLLDARDQGRPPPIWIAAIMLVWANLHASFMLGILIYGAFALEALCTAARDKRGDTFTAWLWPGALSALACLATPYGYMGLLFPFQVSNMAITDTIQEWKPTRLDRPSPFLAMLFGLIFVALTRPLRLGWVRAVIVLALLLLALTSVRHQAIFLIVSTLLLAEPVARAFDTSIDRPLPKLESGGATRSFRVLSGVLLFTALAVRATIPVQPENRRANPVSAIAALPPELKGQPGLNEYSFGGPLILAGWKVFVDGRADMYGDAFMKDYLSLVEKDGEKAWNKADKKWHFAWAMLSPNDKRSLVLSRHSDWKQIHRDDFSVAFVHDQRARDFGLAADNIETHAER